MTTTTPEPVYTVWDRVRYVESTEVYSGEDFTKVLQIAVGLLSSLGSSRPLDASATVALRTSGTPVSAWLAVNADGDERIVYITR